MSRPGRPNRARSGPDEDDPLAGVPVVYREQARTFRQVAYTVLAVLVGVGIDGYLGGTRSVVAHLPGWALAMAVLAGVHVFFVHAANVTKSLAVTDAELVVGDEAIARAAIMGGSVGRLPGEHPALGWPAGFPRGTKALTVRLDDGRDVLVPTRHPDRLAQVLQVAAPEPQDPADELRVRPAGVADLVGAADVLERADAVFRVAGYAIPPRHVDETELAAAAAVLVVGTPVSGTAWVDVVDGSAHLAALAVLPSAMRAGRGSALLDAACEWAAEAGYGRVTVVAFADVPWNAPWLRRRGFTDVAVPGPELRARFAADVALSAVGARVALERVVG